MFVLRSSECVLGRAGEESCMVLVACLQSSPISLDGNLRFCARHYIHVVSSNLLHKILATIPFAYRLGRI